MNYLSYLDKQHRLKLSERHLFLPFIEPNREVGPHRHVTSDIVHAFVGLEQLRRAWDTRDQPQRAPRFALLPTEIPLKIVVVSCALLKILWYTGIGDENCVTCHERYYDSYDLGVHEAVRGAEQISWWKYKKLLAPPYRS